MPEPTRTQKRAANTSGLRPWKPGQSGNPGGRPKKEVSLTAVLRERVDAQQIADKLITMALAGDVSALRYVYDRLEGSPHATGELMLKDERLDEVAERVAQRVNGHDTLSDGR